MRQFEVNTVSLTSAARQLTAAAQEADAARGAVTSQTAGAPAACGQPSATLALAETLHAWSAAIDRLAACLRQYAANTQVAAVLYEEADRSVIPPPLPPPRRRDPFAPLLGGLTRDEIA